MGIEIDHKNIQIWELFDENSIFLKKILKLFGDFVVFNLMYMKQHCRL